MVPALNDHVCLNELLDVLRASGVGSNAASRRPVEDGSCEPQAWEAVQRVADQLKMEAVSHRHGKQCSVSQTS